MFLLDTNILSEIAKRRPDPFVVSRFESTPDAELLTSPICIEEIHFGIRVGPDGELIRRRMEAKVLRRITVLAFTATTAELAGALRGEWKLKGTPVSYRDGLIAASAKEHELILVTRNVRHFDHVSGLTVENWFEPPPPAPVVVR